MSICLRSLPLTDCCQSALLDCCSTCLDPRWFALRASCCSISASEFNSFSGSSTGTDVVFICCIAPSEGSGCGRCCALRLVCCSVISDRSSWVRASSAPAASVALCSSVGIVGRAELRSNQTTQRTQNHIETQYHRGSRPRQSIATAAGRQRQ